MIVAKLLALIGMCSPAAPDDAHLVRAMRQANAAAWQNGRINQQAQRDALDRIEQHVLDDRPAQMEQDAERLREALKTAASRTW